MQYPCGWVSPFGHCRIKACCQLPDTFRRLPRPSSPLTAKASTVCAYSLDHITPSCLGATRIPANGTTYHTFNKAARAARLSLYDTLWTFVSNARYIPIFKEHAPATVPRHLKVCVRSTFRVVGLGGLEPPASPLSGVRSNHLSYRPALGVLSAAVVGEGVV